MMHPTLWSMLSKKYLEPSSIVERLSRDNATVGAGQMETQKKNEKKTNKLQDVSGGVDLSLCGQFVSCLKAPPTSCHVILPEC
jgi:hypothetical protein